MTEHASKGSDLTPIRVVGPSVSREEEILTPEALGFVHALHERFAARRQELLAARTEVDPHGHNLDFLPETAHIRDDPTWRVADAAPALMDRRVEITGPVDAKMSINALNSGAKVWMADFEDATSPTWSNLIEGQVNLKKAIAGTLRLVSDTKVYELGSDLATIVVRPRGWHLPELHVLCDEEPVPASLVDFGLFFFHNARALITNGAGPYFYLPKLESHLEARLWNDVFLFAQDWLEMPAGTIRATVLIETLPAAFQMDEILYELREHAAGLNAGRWDYIFSVIKNFGDDPAFVLPDRSDVTMTVPFMRAYTELLVKTCHARGAHAIGGMAALIPSRDEQQNEIAFASVRADKEREAQAGYDGSWVAHPGLIAICAEAFGAVLGQEPHQKSRLREDVSVTRDDLLAVAETPGGVTDAGVRTNVSVLVRYLDAWLEGLGAAAIDGLMEDAATAEISRCQLWQWIHHSSATAEGQIVTKELVSELLEAALQQWVSGAGRAAIRVEAIRDLVTHGALREDLPAFFTNDAYEQHLVNE